MDGFLIDYLKSGQAWVLVGSGPSIAMGYPSWRELALVAIESVKLDKGSSGLGSAEAAMKRNDFPFVFEECKKYWEGHA